MTYARSLKPVAHIGPPKTATTSLQNGIIPNLGRPFQIKPGWAKSLARDQVFVPPRDLPAGLVVSDEALGDFASLPPEVIATRLGEVFDAAVVVMVERDPLEIFYSLYRQKLINGVSTAVKALAATGKYFVPHSANQFFDDELRKFHKRACGFFALIQFKNTCAVFGRRFDVEVIEFDLLRAKPQAFVEAFSAICSCKTDIALPHENKAARTVMETELGGVSETLPDVLRARFLNLYTSSTLTSDREDFIRNRPQARTINAFVDAFRLGKD